MSNIQYVYYTDPEIENIRTEVATKDDEIPVLLLPVRMETRFMKVPRSVVNASQTDQFEALAYEMTDTNLLLSQDLQKTTAAERTQLFKTVYSRTVRYDRNVGKTKSVTAQQRSWLKEYSGNLESLFLSQEKFSANQNLNKKIKLFIKRLKTKVDNRPIKKQDTHRPSTTLLNELKAIRVRILQILQNKVPYTRPKHKKRLYQFVDRLFEDIEQFYQPGLTKLDKINSIAKEQLDSFQLVHQDIKSQLAFLPKKIQEFHSDSNWRKFVGQKKAQIKNLDQQFTHFDNEIIPRLQFRSTVVTKNADELFRDSLQLYVGLKRLENQPIGTKTEGEQVRKKIRKQVKKLAKDQKKVINSSPEQFANLKNLWKELDVSLNQFRNRLLELKKLKPSPVKSTAKPKLRTRAKRLPLVKKTDNTAYKQALKRSPQTQTFDFYQKANSSIQQLVKLSHNKTINRTLLEENIRQVQQQLLQAKEGKVQLSKGTQTELDSQLKTVRSKVSRSTLKRKDKLTFSKSIQQLEGAVMDSFGDAEDLVFQDFNFSDDALQLNASTDLHNELWVRIFPDDLFVHTHEEALTEQEITAGKNYWSSIWAGLHNETIALDAWRLVCSHYGTKRAAWIVNVLDPAKVSATNQSNFDKVLPKYDFAATNTYLKVLEKELLRLEKVDTKNLTEEKLFIEYAKLAYRSQVRTRFNQVKASLNKYIPKKQPLFLLEVTASHMANIKNYLQLLSKSTFYIQKKFDAGKYSGTQRKQIYLGLRRSKIILNVYQQTNNLSAQLRPLSGKALIEQQTLSFTFPQVTEKDENWNVAPHTNVLPSRFVVVTRNSNAYRHIVVGHSIPDQVQLGMNPESFKFEEEKDNPYQVDENGNLTLEPGIQWLANYDEAVNNGMAITIPLTEEEASNGFDQVFVLGIKNKTEAESKELLEKLLENHHYSADGMNFLPIGTPTNNTDREKAGFGSSDDSIEEAYHMERGQPLFDASESDRYKKTDGQRMAEVLGINPEVFQHVRNSDLTQISEAYAMHAALWHGTIGEAMEDMWDTVFTYDNIERTKAFFTDHVVGRGIVPSLRISTLPYGILPTTAYSRFRPDIFFDQDDLPDLNSLDLTSSSGQTSLKIRFNIRLHQLLWQLNGIWTDIRENEVNHAYNVEQSTNPREHFINMLGLTATTEEIYFRYGLLNSYRGSDGERFVGDFQRSYENQIDYKELFHEYLLQGDFYDDFPYERYGQSKEAAFNQFNTTRQESCQFLDQSAIIAGEVIDDQLISFENLLEEADGKNYIDYLLTNNVYEIFSDNNAKEFPSRSVLYFLLRQSFLLSYREAAMGILEYEDLVTKDKRRNVGGIHYYRRQGGGLYRSKWSYLLLTMNSQNFDGTYMTGTAYPTSPFYVNQSSQQRSMATYLYNGPVVSNHQAFTEIIDNSKSALTALAHLSNQQLDHLLREHLDLCSHRLDAWMTGLANKRLSEGRARQATGIHLGAYAWVEDLRPGGERNVANDVPFPLKDGNPIYTDEDNQGFIHAPSINHAAAAAVLRSAYLANDQEEDLNNQMAVNLSSLRIRKAMQLLNGIQSGMELGSILGYQFEKGLHERYKEVELDKFILPFRKAFPLVVPIDVSTQNAADNLQSNVVNGMDLLNKVNETIQALDFSQSMSLYEVLTTGNFRYCPDWLDDLVKDNGGGNSELKAVIKEIDQIADAFDALGDLAISESVYQIVQGNHVRAAAVLQALGEGKAPPTPLILNTPRTGTVVTHKVMLNILPHSKNPKDWDSALSPRAIAEPSLNNWLAQTIGDPEATSILVEAGKEDLYLIALSDLGLHAIDLLFLVSSDAQNEHLELADLVKYQLRKIENLNPEIPLKVDFSTKVKGEKYQSIRELQLKMAQLKELIVDAIPLAADELMLPGAGIDIDNPGNQNVLELKKRIQKVESTFRKLHGNITAFLSNHPEEITKASDFAKARSYLYNAFWYGMPSALANVQIENTPESSTLLLKKLNVAHQFLSKKIAALDAQITAMETVTSTGAEVRKWIEMAKQLFGNAFLILPQFKSSNPADLKNQLAKGGSQELLIGQQQKFPMDEWLQGIAEVRKKMAAVDTLKIISEADDQDFSELKCCQFPYQEGDYWLGMAYPETYQPANDKQSMIMLQADVLTSATTIKCGMVLDQWVEIIPNKKEVTGITFNYDQPDATAAHSMLLAVTPKKTGSWKWDDLLITLMDTLALAKNRAVEPDQLEKTDLGQLLPALNAEVVPPLFGSSEYENAVGTHLVPMDFGDNLEEEEEEG